MWAGAPQAPASCYLVRAVGFRRLAAGAAVDAWNEIARALRGLHAGLLQCARTEYLREHPEAGGIGPGEMLILATQGEDFAWLRSLSEVMTEIDELRDDAHAASDPQLQAAVRGA